MKPRGIFPVLILLICGTASYAFDAALTESALRALGVPAEQDASSFLESVLPPVSERSGAWDWVRHERGGMLREPAVPSPFVLDFLHSRVGFAHPGEAAPQTWTSLGPEHAESDLPPLPGFPAHRRVRIALDPGHMGGTEWDEYTGKFIRESRGANARRLSEGVLALQVALLLEERLERRGYDVFLTRRRFESASPLRPEDLSLESWAQDALRRKSASTWFQNLLAGFSTQGVSVFTSDPFFQDLHSEKYRKLYFLNGEDLRARAEKIADFQPDLTVVIHFDISEPKSEGADPNGLNPDAYSAVKVYVPGGFFPDEMATQEDRAWYTFHHLHRQRSHASLTLARQLVQSLTLGLGLPTDPNDMKNSVLIEPGVYARNLYLTRRIAVSPVAYVETLFYNKPSEFNALYPTAENQRGSVAGVGYTRRMEQIVASYEKGIEAWLASLSTGTAEE